MTFVLKIIDLIGETYNVKKLYGVFYEKICYLFVCL